MEGCIFCQIIAGSAPADVVDQTETVIVFMSLEGHPMVVTKRHITDVFSLDSATGADVIAMGARIARAMRRALLCDGIYVGQANGSAAGQDVFHYHMHLYPKWADGRGVDHTQAGRSDTAALIRAML